MALFLFMKFKKKYILQILTRRHSSELAHKIFSQYWVSRFFISEHLPELYEFLNKKRERYWYQS
jgi:hypothetical protein